MKEKSPEIKAKMPKPDPNAMVKETLKHITHKFMVMSGKGGVGKSSVSVNLATALRPFTFGLVIVLFLMFEPRGIANWWRIVKSYTKLWPFRY